MELFKIIKKCISGRRILALATAGILTVGTFTSVSLAESYGAGDTGISTCSVSTDTTMRGVWVSSVYGLDYPSTATTDPSTLKANADQILDGCVSMGFNAVFLQVRPSADALYPSSYFPWSKYLTGTQGTAPSDGFDPLAYWVSAAHARGLELHAWINPYTITKGGSADSTVLSYDSPAAGNYAQYVIRYNNDLYFDPGQPAVRELIVIGALEIVNNYDVDGIHMDDYFYPGTDFEDASTFAVYGGGWSNIEDWRRDNVNQLIQALDTQLHQADPDISFGISPTGIWANASSVAGGSDTAGLQHYVSRYADSVTWIRNGWVDYIAPQVYWPVGYSIADYQILADWWAGICAGTDVDLYIGMGDYNSKTANDKGDTTSSWYGTAEVARQLAINNSSNVIKGEIHFRYSSIANTPVLADFYRSAYASGGSSDISSDTTVDQDTGGSDEDTAENTEDSTSAGSALFTDVAGNWAESYITELARDGVISGMGDGTFQPFTPVTRAQFIKLLSGIAEDADLTGDASELGFIDVTDGDWYAGCVAWAVNSGVASGTSDSTFEPDARITREQMAKMVVSFAESQGMTLGSSSDSITFADKSSISDWASAYVDSAVRAGIINGRDSTDVSGASVRIFDPNGQTTRAESAKVISKLRDAA